MDFIYDTDRLKALAEDGKVAYRQATPFPHRVIDGFLRPEAARALADAIPAADSGMAWDRYAAQGFEMKLASSREDQLPETVCRALHELNAGPMLRFLEALTGIGHLLPDPHLLGGGVHLVGPGGHLGVHADFNWHPGLQAHRRINLLLYLNDDWNTDWGGDLELWSTDAARREKAIAPLFNRAVIFNTRSDTFHGHPSPLATPESVWRRSIAMYYYTSQRPEEELREPHNTRYKGMHLP
ncbi:2OG-Fe(II) oxygenase [Arenimonas sp.]|uniref:2OG-Fe(II) oxygenase n=1 Tax=Arenimonas sp. TaxID=1872635 RepID=UPI0035AE3D86